MNNNNFRKAIGQSPPVLDAVQNVEFVNTTMDNGRITVVFTRPCTTGDDQDVDISESDCPFFIFAWGGTVNNAGGIDGTSFHPHKYNPGYKGTSITYFCHSHHILCVIYYSDASYFVSIIQYISKWNITEIYLAETNSLHGLLEI